VAAFRHQLGRKMGKIFFILGVCFLALSLLIYLKVDFSWIGKLPGDLIFSKKNMRFYFPFTTSILVSLLFTLISIALSYFKSKG